MAGSPNTAATATNGALRLLKGAIRTRPQPRKRFSKDSAPPQHMAKPTPYGRALP